MNNIKELDRKVAEAQGWKVIDTGANSWAIKTKDMYSISHYKYDYRPSINWQQAGELLEKYRLNLVRFDDGWQCGKVGRIYPKADTPQISICLAVLAAEGVTHGNT